MAVKTIAIILVAMLSFTYCEYLSAADKAAISELENERLRISFAVSEGGASLLELKDKRSGSQVLPNSFGSFFFIHAADNKGRPFTARSSTGWKSVSVHRTTQTLNLNFNGLSAPTTEVIQVNVRIRLDGSSVFWTADFDHGSRIKLKKVEFPVLLAGPLGQSPEDDYVHYPHASGVVKKYPYNDVSYYGEYPHGFESTYQMMGLYDANVHLYFGAHDVTGGVKTFWADGDGRSMKFSIVWPKPPELEGEVWSLDQPVVTGFVQGGWYEAGQTYQKWAKTAQWWHEPRERTRMDDVPVWVVGGGPNIVEETLSFAEVMGVPVGLHWYVWHRHSFDDNYPQYFPPRNEFVDGLRKLQSKGVVVMPYINGRLWDTDLENFQTTAAHAAIRKQDQSLLVEEYGGNGQVHAPMCPSTDVWRRTLFEIAGRLFKRYGVDGIYFDQVAAAPPTPCFDPNHSHPAGAGSWWVREGYRPLLQRVRGARQSTEFLTSESNAEVFVDQFDGLLTWHYQQQDQAPIFSTIYGQIINLFGRSYKGSPVDPNATTAKLGQSLVFGEQLGWVSPQIIKSDPVAANFLKRLSMLRLRYRSYLQFGQIGKPPEVLGDIPVQTSDWQWQGRSMITVPTLQRGRWHDQSGNELLVFINISRDKKVEFRAPHISSKDYELGPLEIAVLERRSKGKAPSHLTKF
jgi:hypothetical protein